MRFNEAAICSKCGCENIKAHFRTLHPKVVDRIDEFNQVLQDADIAIEWVQRTCSRCSFSWDEEPIDTIKVK